MKIFVITNENGKVIGTARSTEHRSDGPCGGRPMNAAGQRVHEVLSPELEAVRDVPELHKALVGL